MRVSCAHETRKWEFSYARHIQAQHLRLKVQYGKPPVVNGVVNDRTLSYEKLRYRICQLIIDERQFLKAPQVASFGTLA